MMHQGKLGLFNAIDRSANYVSAYMLVCLEVLLTALSVLLYFTVPELRASSAFVIFSAVLLVVSIVELTVVKRKEGSGDWLKWILGISYVLSAITTTSTMGVNGSILFILPMLLSIQYCSLFYSVFMSVITIMGSFVPLLLTSFLTFYDLNVIRLNPGSAVEIKTTLEAALRPEIIDVAGTKINELLAIFLPAISFVIIIAVVTGIITHRFRKNILEQYRQFQDTRE
jgi:hypothetical protein